MFDFTLPFTIDFDMMSGLSNTAISTKRYLSQMKNMFFDDKAYESMLKKEDVLVYEFYELDAPTQDSDLVFGTSITYPGMVGNEYFMTKGHFHSILDTAEVYYCLSGEGCVLMENMEGVACCMELKKGRAVYVPPGFAHRSINTGNIPLVTFFVFRADAGHDYKTIESKGFRKLLICDDGKPVLIDNPGF